MLLPRTRSPDLILETVAHGRFDLAAERPRRGTLIVAYRGLHCPICATYLQTLEAHAADFAQRGVGTIAISSDYEERAAGMAEKVPELRIGYGLAPGAAKQWGLFLSTSRGKTSTGLDEPPVFAEPGIFLVEPDMRLYWAQVQSTPHFRPHIVDVLKALDRVIETNYPARGEFDGAF